ncbi:MAG TPA: GIY-YIG nuclease family protein [Pseudonocardia sp.]
MPNYTVSCGCGRTMSLDALKGRGAFRCGCGVRVRVSDAPSSGTSCHVDGCRFSSVTGQQIRLCGDHRDEITMVLAKDIARTDLKHLADLYHANAGRWKPRIIPVYTGPEVGPTDAAIVRDLPRAGRHDPIVYFLRNGERIKIGTTAHLAARITSLSLRQADVLLALDGGRELEAQLHRRFHEHRIGGTEWFNFSDEIKNFLRAHLERERR